MPILYLVRHGETDLNEHNRREADQILGGQLDVGLNPRGRSQADGLGIGFRDAGIVFSAAACSDLQRTTDTAQRILAMQTGVGLTIDPRLRERGLGAFEGQTLSRIQERFPEYVHGDKADFRASYDHRAPGGEHYGDVEERMAQAIESLEEVHGNILIVSHKHAIRAWLRRALRLSKREALTLPVPNARAIVVARETTYRLIDGLELPT